MADKKVPALQKLYAEEAVPGLTEHFKYKNKFQVPQLKRIVPYFWWVLVPLSRQMFPQMPLSLVTRLE